MLLYLHSVVYLARRRQQLENAGTFKTNIRPQLKGGQPDWAWSEVSEHQDGRRDPLAPFTAWSEQLKVSCVRVVRVQAWGLEGWVAGGLDCSAFGGRCMRQDEHEPVEIVFACAVELCSSASRGLSGNAAPYYGPEY